MRTNEVYTRVTVLKSLLSGPALAESGPRFVLTLFKGALNSI